MSSANFLFCCLLGLGPLVSLSSSNWIFCWVGIELSFLGLIPLLFTGTKFMSMNKESSLKYFSIQAMGSALLFASGLSLFCGYNFFSSLVLIPFFLSLCLKLGLFPGHFWVPSVISGLGWFSCFLVLSVQKVAPIGILSKVLDPLSLDYQVSVLFLGGVSAMIGGLIGNNQTEVRAMLGASSITHTGWLVLGCVSGGIWLYFVLYCGVLAVTLVCMWVKDSLLTCLSLLSLSGLPPFLMFTGKWLILKTAVELGISAVLLSLFLLGAVLSLVFYLKFFYSFYLSVKDKKVYNWGLSLVCMISLNLVGAFMIVLL